MRAIVQWLNRYKSIFLLSIAGALLLLAQSSYWINHTIFNKQTFTSLATSVIEREDSRQAIAATVVDKALEDRPVLQRTISNRATQLVAGLLGTDLAHQTLSGVVDRVYTYATSKDQQPIEVDLAAITTPLAGVIAFAERQGREVAFDPESIPDSIELFDPSGLPNVYQYSVVMLWLGPLCWLGAAGLFAAYIYRGRKVYARRVYIVGAVIIAIGIIGLLAGPIVPPPLVAQVPLTGLRGVVDDLIRTFLQPFTQQMWNMLGITIFTLLLFNQRFTLLKLIQKFVPANSSNNKTTPTVKG